MFATDRDLLIYEPNLFRDFYFLTQRLAAGVADSAESTLTFYPNDNSLQASGVEAGHVVTLNQVCYEIIELTGENEATFSRIRATPTSPIIWPPAHSGNDAAVDTFAPQMYAVHVALLRMISIEPEGEPIPNQPTEADITNPDALKPLECLGTLARIFAAAAVNTTEDHPAALRAAYYEAAFAKELGRAVALIDSGDDGTPDHHRRFNSAPLVR